MHFSNGGDLVDKKILIEVYGVKNGTIECSCCSCECDCNCDCSSTTFSTTGEMYNDLVRYFEKSPLKDNVTIEFIDMANDAFSNFGTIADMLERGFEPPFISIDNDIKLYGSISNELIYEYAEEALGTENSRQFK